MSRRSRRGGFTLVELMFAIAVIAAASLMLCATVGSQQKMNALARERSLATNAIRSYIETMRQRYPAKDQLDMSMFIQGYNGGPGNTNGGSAYPTTQIAANTVFGDPTTPASFLPSSSLESSAMRDARGLVLKMSDETGQAWGACVSSVGPGVTPSAVTPTASNPCPNWLWLDNTMATVGTLTTSNTPGAYVAAPGTTWNLSTGTNGASRAANTPVTSGAYYPNLADLDSMGYVGLGSGSTTVVGRDLDGNAKIQNTETGGACVKVNTQLFVPCQITLSWKSGSGNSAQTAGGRNSRQRITVYAAFGPLH